LNNFVVKIRKNQLSLGKMSLTLEWVRLLADFLISGSKNPPQRGRFAARGRYTLF